MRLTEAYERLQWGRPLLYEFQAKSELSSGRRIGTSAHMLVELYLDLYAAQDSRYGPPQFLVICRSRSQGEELRRMLKNIHGALDLSVGIERVRFFPYDADAQLLRGVIWYSWAIFCDHLVKEMRSKTERNSGPYGLVRSVTPQGEHWQALDRDLHQVGLLTTDGKNELIDMATCPITVFGSNPVTWPANPSTMGPSDGVRLRKAFTR